MTGDPRLSGRTISAVIFGPMIFVAGVVLARVYPDGSLKDLLDTILAVVGIGTLVLLQRQFREMTRATAAAKDAADASKQSADAARTSLRPWLRCDVDVVGPLRFAENGDARLAFRFTVENVGGTPALSVDLGMTYLNLLSPVHEHSILMLERMAAHNRGLPAGPGHAVALPGGHALSNLPGRVLFPGGKWVSVLDIGITRGDIDRACDRIDPKLFWPELLVLVTYSYHMAPLRAATGYVFDVKRVTKTRLMPFAIDEAVQPEQIRLEPHGLWAAFAT